MKIAMGSDERTGMTDAVLALLREAGHEVTLLGALAADTSEWPEVGWAVAEQVRAGMADEGVLCCWTGTGVCMAANKVPGVRAALCVDAETARGARTWNHANVLALSLRLTSEAIAREIVAAWFATPYGPTPGDTACVSRLAEIERSYQRPAEDIPVSR